MDDAATPVPVQVQHALSGTAHWSLGLAKFGFGPVTVDGIGGDSPAGERSRAGTIDLVTQPANVPPRLTQDGAVHLQGLEA